MSKPVGRSKQPVFLSQFDYSADDLRCIHPIGCDLVSPSRNPVTVRDAGFSLSGPIWPSPCVIETGTGSRGRRPQRNRGPTIQGRDDPAGCLFNRQGLEFVTHVVITNPLSGALDARIQTIPGPVLRLRGAGPPGPPGRLPADPDVCACRHRDICDSNTCAEPDLRAGHQ